MYRLIVLKSSGHLGVGSRFLMLQYLFSISAYLPGDGANFQMENVIGDSFQCKKIYRYPVLRAQNLQGDANAWPSQCVRSLGSGELYEGAGVSSRSNPASSAKSTLHLLLSTHPHGGCYSSSPALSWGDLEPSTQFHDYQGSSGHPKPVARVTNILKLRWVLD